MAIKVKDLKISFDLDEMEWGDLRLLGNRLGLLEFCKKYAVIDGVDKEDVPATLSKLSYWETDKIDDLLGEFIRNQRNPVDETGKN